MRSDKKNMLADETFDAFFNDEISRFPLKRYSRHDLSAGRRQCADGFRSIRSPLMLTLFRDYGINVGFHLRIHLGFRFLTAAQRLRQR